MACVLLVDDDLRHASALEAALALSADGTASLECVGTLGAALDRLAGGGISAIFLSLSLPLSSSEDPLDRIRHAAPDVPVVVLAGAAEDARCRDAMRRGAHDYLLEGHLDVYAFARAMRNIAERGSARRALLADQEHAQVTLNSIGDAVMSTDVSGRVTYMNVVAEEMTGWSGRDALGRPLTDVFRIIDSLTREPSPNPLALAVALGRPVGLSANCALVRRDGLEAAIADSSAPIRDRDGRITGAVIVFHDVSTARALALEMSHRARHDALTDLPNRLLLMDRLMQAIVMARRTRQRVAVLFLDVDGFKRINDTMGHAAGDQLLTSIGASLSSCVRASDTVSRQGGDEFVILLPALERPGDAAVCAETIVTRIRRMQIAGSLGGSRLSVSLGIATFPESGEDAATLIANADAAMYYAKSQGRDQYRFFDPDMLLRRVGRVS